MSVPDYYHRFNPELLQSIPPGAGVVVEVGCAAGTLGTQYRLANPATCYVGIELHAEAAALAATRLSRVIVGNVETLSDTEIGLAPGSVDCLVYGDVLEHLVDPWTALKRHAAWLKPGGQVAACIPNIQHWSMLIRVLTGSWCYEDEGLLDRTHLRFFSLETIQQMFVSAGLRVTSFGGRVAKVPEWERLQPLVRPLLDACNVPAANYAFRSATVQYVILAVKPTG